MGVIGVAGLTGVTGRFTYIANIDICMYTLNQRVGLFAFLEV